MPPVQTWNFEVGVAGAGFLAMAVMIFGQWKPFNICGEINLICVKDFSRFSRDYIETGNYLECTFPFMGCLLYTSRCV